MSSAGSEGESSSSLGAGDAHAHGTAIQGFVDRLMEPFLSPLEALVAGAVREESARDELTEAAVRGLRDGVVGHAINARTGGSFAVTVCAAVRKRAAAYVRYGCDADGDPDEWLDAHFSEPALRQRLGLPDSDAGIASTIDDLRGLAKKVVLKHRRLANAVAKTFHHPGLDQDDLEQEAAMGLRKAVLSYRPADGTPFEAYARSVIHHHLSSVVRTANGATDHFARCIEEFVGIQERLAHEWRRQPSEEEVFDALGWGSARCEKARSVMRMLSTQALPTAAADQNEVTVRCPRLDPQQQAVEEEVANAAVGRLRRLPAALERLSHDQREIINLRYYENLSFTDIGERVGLTPRQVRTRHKNALEALKREVDGAGSVLRSKGSA